MSGPDTFVIRAEVESMLRVQDVGSFVIIWSIHTQDGRTYGSRTSVDAVCQFSTAGAYSIGYVPRLALSSRLPLPQLVDGEILCTHS